MQTTSNLPDLKKSYKALRDFWVEVARAQTSLQLQARRPSNTYFPWRRESTPAKQMSQFSPMLRSPVDRQAFHVSAEDFQIWFDDTHCNGDGGNKFDEEATITPAIHISIEPPSPQFQVKSPISPGSRVAALIDVFEHGHALNGSEFQSGQKVCLQNPPDPSAPRPIGNAAPATPNSHHVNFVGPGNPPKHTAGDEQWQPKDLGDVAMKLRNDETLFERRQKYQSMFKDAPLYQMYNERVARREHGAKTSVRVSSDDISQTNSLEFQDNNFAPIDDEDHLGDKPDIELLASAAFDLWRQRASAAAAAKPPLSVPKRGRSKSPELKILDNRARSRSPEAQSPTLSSMVKRTPSEPVEMQRFAAQIAGTGPKRVSWSNMPQVVENRLAENLTPVQRKLQESLFEIMTSEASYFRSLNVLIEVFYRAPCMQAGTEGALVTHTEKHHLFSNILEIIMTSESFLRAMEGCFRKDPWLTNLLEIVYKYSEADFQAYVTYVQNQTYQNRTLCKLRQHPAFLEAIKQLQTHPECAFLDLNSFLLLPMQRVMRLRLLTSTVLHYAPKNSTVYRSGLVALASLELLLAECDSKKLYMEQKERLMELTIRFEYKLDAKSVATESRRLVKEGELRLVTVTKQTGSAFQRRLSGIRRQKVVSASLFLFNDLLIIAKQRSNKKLMVDDSCPLTAITTQANGTPAGAVITRYYNSRQSKEDKDLSSVPPLTDRKDSLFQSSSDLEGFATYPFSLFIESPEHPKAEYRLQAKSLSERERWLDALCPTQFATSDEALIRDCPQLLAKRSYPATAGDELELREGDTAYLLVRLSDGWCKGMLPDGRKGWFPTSVCDEMNDATIKHENMKNCLLMEEARNAYKRRKAKENFIEFPKVKETK